MIKVLRSIRLGDAMPPIEVLVEVAGVDGLSHRLYDGRHRLAASIAVAYSHVRAVVVRDLDAIKRSEGIA
jgi:ParB-like chromosome segregation protein Spo0J